MFYMEALSYFLLPLIVLKSMFEPLLKKKTLLLLIYLQST